MAEEVKKGAPVDKKAPQVVNAEGSTRSFRSERGGRDDRRGRGRRGDRRDEGPKEFNEITISIDRVARVVKGGRRFRFKALVAVGDGKQRVGIGIAKGQDVTSAVTKATNRAKKAIINLNLDGETIPHEIETKVDGARVLLKPAAPGTGIIAGGVVRQIIGLTGVKNLISKSLGSTNKVNIAYAVIAGLAGQEPKALWLTNRDQKVAKKEAK